MGDVQGSGRVRGDELDVHADASLRGVRAVRGAGIDDDLRQCTGGSGIETDVDEPRACDLGARDAVDGGEAVDDLLCELARVRAERLGQAHGDVRGPVAVVAVAGALQHDVGCGELQRLAGTSFLGDRCEDGEEGCGEGFGVHSLPSLRGRKTSADGADDDEFAFGLR